MDRLHIFLVFLGVASYLHGWISGSVLEVTVRPGDNITLYCECKTSPGVYIVWYRNCSHENQPSLVLKLTPDSVKKTRDAAGFHDLPPRFHFVRNYSSESYDLMIMNITDSDEGLYYCGTAETKVEDKEYITHKHVFKYGNDTRRIIVNSNEPHLHETPRECGVCWSLLFSLCPAFAVLSSLLSSLVVYHLCKKKAKEPQADQRRPDTQGQTRLNQDQDVCYAALDIRQASQRPKKKKIQSSDFSTYSAINTSRM